MAERRNVSWGEALDESGKRFWETGIGHTLADALDYVKLPGQVAKGEVSAWDPETGHVSDDIIRKSAGGTLAMGLGSGAVQAAKPGLKPDGDAFGVFVGRKGGERLGKGLELEVAQGLHKQGFPIEDIRRQTGWSHGPRGEHDWQYEISDHDMAFKPDTWVANPAGGLKNQHPTFSETVDHPEFLQAYPEAASLWMRASVDPLRPPGGVFDSRMKRIETSGMDEREAREILGHELQHTADEFEKKPGGSNPRWTRQVIERELMGELPPEAQAAYRALSENEKQRMAYRRYRHDAGEVNAEITRNRLDMTPEQRLEREPMMDRPKDIDPDLITLGRASAGYAGPVKAEMAMPDRTFSPGKGMDDYERVDADVRKLDVDLAKDRENYVGQGGAGGIGKRYENFGQWLKDNPDTPVEMPRMGIDGFDRPSFGNGRHRFAHFRDSGATELPVMVNKEQAQAFRDRYGAAALAEALDRAGE